ncbi:hypothetical protein KHC28_01430 [Ancylobacter sonchi]|nr:hypothetical protein [Ancylobacter sonchi]
MPEPKRLAFFAEGLPIILESAQGFWNAAQQIKDSSPRESAVLEGFAEEEAAKILILMDAVRCPAKLVAGKLNVLIGWFYDHLARLIYAEAADMKPTDLAELRRYVYQHRRSHSLEGHAGEYIMPNGPVYDRERKLYADIEAYDDSSLAWSAPSSAGSSFRWFLRSEPYVLRVTEAMHQLGMFSVPGLRATSQIWGTVEFKDTESHQDGNALMEALVKRLILEKLPLDTASQKHVSTLHHDWQIPMYNLDLSPIVLSRQQLEDEQERAFWREFGDGP